MSSLPWVLMNKYQKLNTKWWSIDRHKSLTIIIDNTYEIITKIVYFINRARHFAIPVGTRWRKDVCDTIHFPSEWDPNSVSLPQGQYPDCQRVFSLSGRNRRGFSRLFVTRYSVALREEKPRASRVQRQSRWPLNDGRLRDRLTGKYALTNCVRVFLAHNAISGYRITL